MNVEELNNTLNRAMHAIVISNERDDRIWELIRLSDQSYIKLQAFSDVQSNRWGIYQYRGEDTDVEVVSVGRAVSMYQDGEMDIFLIYSSQSEYDETCFQNLRKLGIDEKKIWFIPYEYVFQEKKLTQDTISEITPYLERKELETVELHAAEHCNLNCKFCSMFCGLVKEPVFPNYEFTKRGMKELKRYIKHVKKVRIVGGEPLLNPELERYIDMVRDIYPYTDIRLISNGILVKNMRDSLIQSLVRNNVTFIVTGYQPLMDKQEEIHQFLESKGVRHSIGHLVMEFQKIYDYRGNGFSESNYNVCNWKKSCATLYENKLAPCFPPFVIHYMSEAFDLDIPESGILDLYEKGMSSERIHRFFDTPFDLCRYCADKRLFAKWERIQSGDEIKIEDWSV